MSDVETNTPWRLPESWCWSKFDAVAEVESNLVDPASFLDMPHVAPNHIESGTGRLLPYATIREDGVGSPKHRFWPGQILYSKIRPYLAKCVRVDFEGLCSADMYPIRADIDPVFLLRWILTSAFTENIVRSQGRTVLPKTNEAALSKQWVPVPPAGEQVRIARRVQSLQTRLEASREALDAIPPLLEKFRQSVLAAAFRGDLTREWREQNPIVEPASTLLEKLHARRRDDWNDAKPGKAYAPANAVDVSNLPSLPDGWCWATLQQIASATRPIGYGVVQPGDDVENGVKLVRVCDIEGGRVDTRNLRSISSAIDSEYRRSRLEGDEVLVTVVGTIGRVAPATQEIRGANIARAVARVVPLLPHLQTWIALALLAPDSQHALLTESREVARKTLNISTLEQIAVPLCPEREAQEIVSRIQNLVDRARAIQDQHSSAVTALRSVDQAILAKAFRGELVPQDPNDEPASVLLERIRAERAAAPTPTKRGRKPRS